MVKTVHYDMPAKRERNKFRPADGGLTEDSLAGEPIYRDAELLEYSNVWFHRDTAPCWQALDSAGVWPPKGATRYLEIGVCEGASLFWILRRARKLELATVVDPFIAPKRHNQKKYDEHERRFQKNCARWLEVREQYHSTANIEHVKAPSSAALIAFLANNHREPYDAIYVDGAHDAPTVMLDLTLAFQLLKPGGVMVVDDLHRRWHLGKPWVHEGFNGWMMAYEKQVDVVHRNQRQAALIKKG